MYTTNFRQRRITKDYDQFAEETLAIEIKVSWKGETQIILTSVEKTFMSIWLFFFFRIYFVCKLRMSQNFPCKKSVCKGCGF